VTPRQIKEQFYKAARTDDAALALRVAKEFMRQHLWTSTAHYAPLEPDGTEQVIFAACPGTCVLCHKEFRAYQEIRWRSRVDCHVGCWDQQFGGEAHD
jgi:hypothetical protein